MATKITKAQKHVNDLFDYACQMHEGFTKRQACDALEMSAHDYNKALTALRHAMAGTPTTLTCEPNSSGQQWTYRLIETSQDGEFWVNNRVNDARSRLLSLQSFTESLVHATDGRTRDGRMVREMHMTARQLIERLNLIDEVYTS